MDGRKKKFIRELCEKKKTRSESGLFVVDGPKMCGEAPAESVTEVYVTEAFLSSPSAASCAELLTSKGYTVINDSDMKQISDTVSPQGILCVCTQKKIRGIRALMEGRRNETPLLILLETLQDPGNLGTIFRAGEACGVTGIIMNDTTADVYSPKAARSTMGSLFRVPFLYVSDLRQASEDLSGGKYTGGVPVRTVACDLLGACDYTAVNYREPCAFMIGNESKGLTEELKETASVRVKIPMMGAVESLNAAMAATVMGFEAARQRRDGWR